ncbi:MAG: zinc ribbon domain-containing protein, partial [Chloroflexota bacterium]|nr:zinc ribbon domain-containing protein [Chloroflexota bacterium]
MTSPGNGLLCARCHLMNSADARYCARCGEPVNPQLVADLRRIYETLTELDERIAAGEGALSVQALRDTLRERYLAERSGPQGAAAGVAAPPTVPLAQSAPAAQGAAASPSVPLAQRAIPVTPPLSVAPVAPAAALVAPAQPHGPVFSWRAFIAEQAIAVMAYLGGFLLLIATLTFEVGGWQALPDIAKLGGVLGVYLIFGALGIGLRRAASLRTVSRVYLGVFALMTPLAALAVYRFELQARGFSIAGMVCLAAAYAAVVYLALAVRTRFVTYAYLGWAALLLSALAIPTWAQASHYWWIPVANLVALLLLAPRLLRLARPSFGWLDAIEPSATQISASVASLGALATILLELATANGQANGGPIGMQLGPIAAAACALVPLALGWSRAARTLGRLADNDIIMALDWLVALSFAVAASAVATWLGASPAAYTYTMAGTALAVGLAVEALASRQRLAPRIATQILAAALAAYSALLGVFASFSAPHDYAPALVASAVGVALGLLFALRGPLGG